MRSRLSPATASVSSIEIVVLLIVTRSMALRKFATGLAVSSPSAIVLLAFPALETELPSGWASEIAIDRVKRERRLRLTAPAVEVGRCRPPKREGRSGEPRRGERSGRSSIWTARATGHFTFARSNAGTQLACPDHCSVKRISMRRFLA